MSAPTLRTCKVCNKFRSKEETDPHSTCGNCRGRECSFEDRCAECDSWDSLQWEVYSASVARLARRRGRERKASLPAAEGVPGTPYSQFSAQGSSFRSTPGSGGARSLKREIMEEFHRFREEDNEIQFLKLQEMFMNVVKGITPGVVPPPATMDLGGDWGRRGKF